MGQSQSSTSLGKFLLLDAGFIFLIFHFRFSYSCENEWNPEQKEEVSRGQRASGVGMQDVTGISAFSQFPSL